MKHDNIRVDKFLKLAKKMAEFGDFYKYRLGACIVKKNKKLSMGYNNKKSHPLQRYYNKERIDIAEDAPHYVHAEMAAIIEAKIKNIDLNGAEIFVYRISRTNKPAMARPCPACMKALKEHGIFTLHYTTNEGMATEKISEKFMAMPKARGLI